MNLVPTTWITKRFNTTAIRILAIGILLCLAVAVPPTNAFAQSIVLTGDHSPSYNGTDNPWDVGDRLKIGLTGVGTMNVSNAGLVNSYQGLLGESAGSNGTATLSGGSEWNMGTSQLFAGNLGVGTLNVFSGSKVNSLRGHLGNAAGSLGTATVNGVGSRWDNNGTLTLGQVGSARLNIEAGGVVTNTDVNVASRGGSNGFVRVVGPGSQWINSGYLYVSNAGNATLDVENGAVVSNTMGAVGLTNVYNGIVTGVATVKDSGSQWNNSEELTIGYNGKGFLNVENGGVVTNTDGFVARNSFYPSRGNVTVTGAGSQWNSSGNLYIGGNSTAKGGTATLDILDNGKVSVGGILKVWDSGQVKLAGGILDVGTLDFSAVGARFEMSGGTLAVDQFQGDLIQTDGVLSPGDSPGLTFIDGDYIQSSPASVLFEIEGLNRGVDYDALNVAGIADLNGEILIELGNGFSAAAGDTFDLIDATSITGTASFDFSGAALSNGLVWDTSSFVSNGSVTIVSAVPEPAAAIVLGFLTVGLMMRRRK